VWQWGLVTSGVLDQIGCLHNIEAIKPNWHHEIVLGKEQRRIGTLALQRSDQRGKHPGLEMGELPRLALWISDIKVGKQFSVREVQETRGIISHHIDWAGDIITGRPITVVALMECMYAKKICHWP
jgi:hypothetical protein